jgi:hypothetical protein
LVGGERKFSREAASRPVSDGQGDSPIRKVADWI